MVIAAETDAAARFLEFRATEPLAHQFADERHPGLAAAENHLVQILWLNLGVGQCAEAMRPRAGDDVVREAFQFGTCQSIAETEIRCEKRQRNSSFGFSG